MRERCSRGQDASRRHAGPQWALETRRSCGGFGAYASAAQPNVIVSSAPSSGFGRNIMVWHAAYFDVRPAAFVNYNNILAAVFLPGGRLYQID